MGLSGSGINEENHIDFVLEPIAVLILGKLYVACNVMHGVGGTSL